MTYRTLEYTVSFTTPGFLGNADQDGQWRTPPFKALLRQWWRVVYAADHGFEVNVAQMRREEGRLFGHAWLEDDCDDRRQKVSARKSLVRVRLDSWAPGKLKSWPLSEVSIRHPEVPKEVGSQLYLGYGPLVSRAGTALKAKAAIQAGEQARLLLAFPDENADALKRALTLMSAYGTAGGRSRNGWGSFFLSSVDAESALEISGHPCVRAWRDCLNLDWPHAIGEGEEGPLVWQTGKSYNDWKLLMRDLAIIKIGLRTQFVFPNEPPPHQAPLARHWLSYPITRHGTRAWKGTMRLPNSLRFKVRPDADEPNKLRGVIFHVPCRPPPEFRPNLGAVESTWQQVHALLDHLNPNSSRKYPMISDSKRRDVLKTQLDSIALERISQ